MSHAFTKCTHILTTLSNALNSVASWWLILDLVLMSGLIGTQVFCRYVLNNSLFWSEEVGRILLVQITFLGASIAFKSGLHPSIRTLVERFSLANQRRIELFTLAVSLAFFATLAWYGTHFSLFISKQVTPSLGISKALPVAIIPLASAITALHALTAMFVSLQKKDFENQIDNDDTHKLRTFLPLTPKKGTPEGQSNHRTLSPTNEQMRHNAPAQGNKQCHPNQSKHGGQQ